MSEMPTDIPFEKLVDLVENRLPAEEQAQLLAQLAANQHTTAELAWLEQTIGLMRSDNTEDAPDYVINRALRLLRPRPAPEKKPGLLERVIAVLQFDSTRSQPAIGVRSGKATERNVLYNAKGCDLDLRIIPSGALWRVSGQVLGPDEGGQVELSNASVSVVAALNDLSEFSLPPVAAGNYTLTLQQGDIEVVILDLELGSSSNSS